MLFATDGTFLRHSDGFGWRSTTKVVTWNIDFKTDKSQLWDYIDTEIHPDILLVQECKEYPSSYQGIGKHIGGTRLWGSMVLSKKYSLEPIYLPNHLGWVTGAKLEIEDYPVLVFSVHAKLKNIGGYVVPHLKHIFTDIMLVADDYEYLVIGGDFNAARLYDECILNLLKINTVPFLIG